MKTLSIALCIAALSLVACSPSTPRADASRDIQLIEDDVIEDAASDVSIDAEASTPDVIAVDAAEAGAPDGSIAEAGDVRVIPTCDPDAGRGDSGCYLCPQSSAQFLDRCGSNACAPFDNRARLPRLLADGGLPPL